jgi:hypothetical protein
MEMPQKPIVLPGSFLGLGGATLPWERTAFQYHSSGADPEPRSSQVSIGQIKSENLKEYRGFDYKILRLYSV